MHHAGRDAARLEPVPHDSVKQSRQLAPPAVAPEEYDDTYYLRHCAGSEDYEAAVTGHEIGGIYRYVLQGWFELRRGDVIVDVGCGRGELIALAAELGAERAVGVEYADSAVALAEQTISRRGVTGRAQVLHADARSIPLADAIADGVTMLDVVEHLAPDELHEALVEVRRLLKPGGRLLIHTFPNRLVYDVTYRAHRALCFWQDLPADPRHSYEHRMHVNEQTRSSLRRALKRAGFERPRLWYGAWIHTTFLPDGRGVGIYHRLAKHRLTKPLGCANIFAEARSSV